MAGEAKLDVGVQQGGFPWREEQLTTVNRRLAGAHEKQLFRDPDGAEWMFKPQDTFRAEGDIMAAKMAEALGIETAEVHMATIGGRRGSIQRMFTEVAGDAGALPATGLTEAQAVAIQREHVFDWLISQHDTHAQNILLRSDASLGFIDKGQTFRFFGNDKLDLVFGKPGTPNPSGTYYQKMFAGYANGDKVPLAGVDGLEEFFKRIDSLSDDEFRSILRPYARAATEAAKSNPGLKRAAWMGRFDEEQFLDAAVARKNAARGDFKKFYDDLQAKRDKVLKPAGAPTGSRARFTKAGIKEADDAGWAGRSYFVKGDDYEGMNLLLYGSDGDGTFLQGKLRASADRRLMELLGKASESVGKSVVADPYFSDVLKIAKSFNHHLKAGGDGAIPAHTTTLFNSVFKTLTAASKGRTIAAKRAKHYLAFLEEVRVGEKWKTTGLGKNIAQFTAAAEDLPKTTKLLPGWKVDKVAVGDTIDRNLQQGRIVSRSSTPVHTMADGGGGTYKIVAPDGTTFIYRQHASGTNFSAQGEIKLWIDKPIRQLSPKELEKAMANLKTLGLETAEATAKDLELLYLRKLAFKEKLDVLALETVSADLPVAKQIDGLKTFLGKKKRGLKFTAGSGYKPEPTFDKGGRKGWARWLGHHIPDEEISDLRPYHRLFNGVAADLEAILDGGTGGLIPTMAKLRAGMSSVRGMSPGSDVGTGGASYVFTRMRRSTSQQAGLYFKRGLLKDLDAVTYGGDKFGNVTSDVIGSRLGRGRADETIYKNGIDFEKWIDRIGVSNSQERGTVLRLFEQRGIKTLGGRPVKDVVEVVSLVG